MKVALALCGGGSKGSYELGAWEALRELNIAFDIVTGTSIGSLNGLMVVQGEYERCRDLWNSIEIHNVITDGFNLDEINIRSAMSKYSEIGSFFKRYVTSLSSDIVPFKSLLREYLKPDLIRSSKIEFGIVSAQFPSRKGVEVIAKDLTDYQMYQYILASCSCFPVFPACKIDGKQYIDGGFYDNLPISMALKMGAEEIIAIDLNPNVTHPDYLNRPFVKYIYPSWDLGSFLFFDRQTINRNRLLGYYDTMKQYGKYDGFKYTFDIESRNSPYCRKITLKISQEVDLYRRKKRKSIIAFKQEQTVFTFLEKNSTRVLTDYDYFIKTLETCGLLFDLEPTNVYTIISFVTTIYRRLIEYFENEVDFIEQLNSLSNTNKKKELILSTDDKIIVSSVFKEMFNDNVIDINFKFMLMQYKPIVYLAVVFLEIFSEIPLLGENNEV